MAPELVGDAAPSPALVDRTDVWSVGALAFQLLTGQLPWSHDVPAPLRHMVAEAAVPWEVRGGACTGRRLRTQSNGQEHMVLGAYTSMLCRRRLQRVLPPLPRSCWT